MQHKKDDLNILEATSFRKLSQALLDITYMFLSAICIRKVVVSTVAVTYILRGSSHACTNNGSKNYIRDEVKRVRKLFFLTGAGACWKGA